MINNNTDNTILYFFSKDSNVTKLTIFIYFYDDYIFILYKENIFFLSM